MTAGVDIGADSVLADLHAATELLRRINARLAPDQVWSCGSGEVIDLLRAQAELDSVAAANGLAMVREADVRCLASDHGQTSTGAWLAQLLRLNQGEAKARVQEAGVLSRQAPDIAAALAAGRINPDQARAITTALTDIAKVGTAGDLANAETTLLDEAHARNAGKLKQLGDYIVAVLDPDGIPERAERAKAERSLTITNLGNGRHRLRGTLPDEAAAIVNAALDPLAAPRPAQEGEKDPRTATQRRADALVDLAASYLRYGELPKTRGARPHVHVTATLPTLDGDTAHPFARTATGEDLDFETLRKICCDAGITPILLNTLGEPLAVGRESRTVTPAIWAALVARDIGCAFAGCTRHAAWCQAHHIKHWIDDGETELCNCALVCDFHHDQIHHHGWEIRLADDGHPELIPPAWVDPSRRPQRNTHWKLLRDGLHADPDRGP